MYRKNNLVLRVTAGLVEKQTQDYVGMSIIIGFCQTLSVSLPVLFSTVFAVLCKCDANKNLSNHKLASTKLAENEPPVRDVCCMH